MGCHNRDHQQRRNINENKFSRIFNRNMHNVGTAFIRRGKFYETEVASMEAVCTDDGFVYARFPCKNTVANRLNTYCIRLSLKDPVAWLRWFPYNKPIVIEQEDEELF